MHCSSFLTQRKHGSKDIVMREEPQKQGRTEVRPQSFIYSPDCLSIDFSGTSHVSRDCWERKTNLSFFYQKRFENQIYKKRLYRIDCLHYPHFSNIISYKSQDSFIWNYILINITTSSSPHQLSCSFIICWKSQ